MAEVTSADAAFMARGLSPGELERLSALLERLLAAVEEA
jgi:hypothetical protein